MASRREVALEAIVALLGAEGSPAATVFRSRLEQIGAGSLPAYDVAPHEEKTEDPGEFGDRQSVTHTLTVKVCAVVAAPAGEFVDDSVLDPFYVFAADQLTGNGANLSGEVEDVEEVSSAFVFQPGGREILGLEMTFAVHFATKRGNSAQRG